MFFGRKKSKDSQSSQKPTIVIPESELSRFQSPKPANVYKERSAVDFQAEELARLQGNAASSQKKSDSRKAESPSTPQQQRPLVPKLAFPSPAANGTDLPMSEEKKKQRFQVLKSELESALRSGITEDIVDAYRNLGQHFMEGKSMQDQQAAKQMFQKALEHANRKAAQERTPEQSPSKPQKQSSQDSNNNGARSSVQKHSTESTPPQSPEDGRELEDEKSEDGSNSQSQNTEDQHSMSEPIVVPPAQTPESSKDAAVEPAKPAPVVAPVSQARVAGGTRKIDSASERTLVLVRAPLQGKPVPPDGLVGVGFSFVTQPDGSQVISSMAPTGSAASSGQMVPGDELLSVNGVLVRGKATEEIIKLVKGKPGTKVTLVLATQSSETQSSKPVGASPKQTGPPQIQKDSKSVRERVQQMQQKLGSNSNTHPASESLQPSIDQTLQGQGQQLVDSLSLGQEHIAKQSAQIQTGRPKPLQPPQMEMAQHQSKNASPSEFFPVQQHDTVPSSTEADHDIQLRAPVMQVLPLPPEPTMPAPRHVPSPQPYSNPRQQTAQIPGNVLQSAGSTSNMIAMPMQAQKLVTPLQIPASPITPNAPISSQTPLPAQQVQTQYLPSNIPVIAGQVPYGASPTVTYSPQPMQSPSLNHSPPAGKRKGKRMVFTREPFRGQVVLPEHPVGIGLSVSSNEKGGHPFFVDSVLPESAAALSGQVRPGDVLYSIDGIRVKGKSLHEVIQMIKGPSGTQVAIVFQSQEQGFSGSSQMTSFVPRQQLMPNGRKQSMYQAYEMRIDILSAEGLPIRSAQCDPFACISLLHESTSNDKIVQISRSHKLTAQVRTKVVRRTTSPTWREQHVLKELLILDSARPDRELTVPEKDPLCGQPVIFLVTSHDQAIAQGHEDFVGYALVPTVRVGPPTDHWLPLLDSNSKSLSVAGHDALIHVRISYGAIQIDVHQTEAAQKAAEMALARRRREEIAANEGYKDSAFGEISRRRELDGLVTRSQSGTRGEQLMALQPPTTPSHSTIFSATQPELAAISPGSNSNGWKSHVANSSPNTVWGEQNSTPKVERNQEPIFRSDDVGRQQDSRMQANSIATLELEQSRRDLVEKEKEINTLQIEHARLKDRLSELTQLHEMSLEASKNSISSLRSELVNKDEQIKNLQSITDQAVPIQQRLEEQLRSAQQLVRGSLLQHERYETQAEHHLKEISELRREKERLERDLAVNKKEQSETSTNGAQTLEELIEFERKRFKKALADERSRSSEVLDKERTHYEKLLREVRLEANKQMDLALAESSSSKEDRIAIARECQKCTEEAQELRASVQREKQVAALTIQELKDQVHAIRKQLLGPDVELSTPSSRAWAADFDHGKDGMMQKRRDTYTEKEIRGLSREEDYSRLQMRLETAEREREQIELELRSSQNTIEKLKSEYDGHRVDETDPFNPSVDTPRKRRVGGMNEDDSQQDLASKLKEKDRQFNKLQKEYKRLQIIAAGRSPANLRSGSPGW